jgi:hypothetical protein
MNQTGFTCAGSMTTIKEARRQSGAALFVGLFMLLLISIVAVAGIRSVVMEKSMATNSHYEMLVFQGAESAIEGILADEDVFVEAINLTVGDPLPARSFTLDHDSHSFSMVSDATISSGVPEVPVGYSLGEYMSYPFTITSSSTIASINATDTHVQTASKIAPFLF